MLWAASGLALLFMAVTFASGPAGAATTKSSSASSRSLSAYRSCLAKHGVKLPTTAFTRGSGASFPHSGSFPGGSFPHSGSFPGGSFPHSGSFPGGGSFPGSRFATNSKTAKAFADCASKAPKGFRPFGGAGGSGTPTAAQTAALKNYDVCMADHGVQIAATATYQTIRSLIASDPAAATANTSCQSDLQGAFGPPARSSTSTTTG